MKVLLVTALIFVVTSYFRTKNGLWAHLKIILSSPFINQLKIGQTREGYFMVENRLLVGKLMAKLELVLKSPDVKFISQSTIHTISFKIISLLVLYSHQRKKKNKLPNWQGISEIISYWLNYVNRSYFYCDKEISHHFQTQTEHHIYCSYLFNKIIFLAYITFLKNW